MKRTMKTAFMTLCAVTMLAVTASCSSDKNEVDYPKTTEQVLNHMVGEYKGTLGFSTTTETTTDGAFGQQISWKIDKNHNIIIEKFPYVTLANGVSKQGVVGKMSVLFQTLLDVKDAPLYIVMAGSNISDNRMSLKIDPLFYTPLSAPNADYEIVGSIKKVQPMFTNYYNIKESKINATLGIAVKFPIIFQISNDKPDYLLMIGIIYFGNTICISNTLHTSQKRIN